MEKEKAKKALLKHTEVFAEGLITDLYDDAMESAKDSLKKLIPGQVDDAIIDLVMMSLKPVFKAELMKQIEKISAE